MRDKGIKDMNIKDIKQAVNEGKNVYWRSLLYKVIKDKNDDYFIKCNSNNVTWL